MCISTETKAPEAAMVEPEPGDLELRYDRYLRGVMIEAAQISNLYAELKGTEDLVSPGNNACLGCNAELALRFTLRILGPNTIVAIPPSCMGGTGVVGFGQNTGAKVPVFFPLLDNIASMLAGMKRMYNRLGRRDVNVVAFAGDGGTADVGFQCLSGAAERQENILYICYDNEGYMNTGIQRSGTTPWAAWTSTTPVGEARRGKRQPAKNMPMIMAMHGCPYVATATMAYPYDYAVKLRKAMKVKDGLAYIHLFSPCPTGWRFPWDQSLEVSRLAVETNFFPLWEAEGGKFRITKEIEFPKPVGQYTKSVGKYAHLNDGEIERLQKMVEANYRQLVALTTL